jgi:hypothetical protein
MVREALQSNMKWVLLILAVLALVVLSLALGTIAFGNRAQAAAPPPPATGSGAPSAADGGPFGCTISNIAVFSNRIHVHCSSPIPSTSISYFASSGDSEHALVTNRFLAILNTAYSLGKPVYIYYLDNAASNPPGCNSGDCRAIDWLFIVP